MRRRNSYALAGRGYPLRGLAPGGPVRARALGSQLDAPAETEEFNDAVLLEEEFNPAIMTGRAPVEYSRRNPTGRSCSIRRPSTGSPLPAAPPSPACIDTDARCSTGQLPILAVRRRRKLQALFITTTGAVDLRPGAVFELRGHRGPRERHVRVPLRAQTGRGNSGPPTGRSFTAEADVPGTVPFVTLDPVLQEESGRVYLRIRGRQREEIR